MSIFGIAPGDLLQYAVARGRERRARGLVDDVNAARARGIAAKEEERARADMLSQREEQRVARRAAEVRQEHATQREIAQDTLARKDAAAKVRYQQEKDATAAGEDRRRYEQDRLDRLDKEEADRNLREEGIEVRMGGALGRPMSATDRERWARARAETEVVSPDESLGTDEEADADPFLGAAFAARRERLAKDERDRVHATAVESRAAAAERRAQEAHDALMSQRREKATTDLGEVEREILKRRDEQMRGMKPMMIDEGDIAEWMAANPEIRANAERTAARDVGGIYAAQGRPELAEYTRYRENVTQPMPESDLGVDEERMTGKVIARIARLAPEERASAVEDVLADPERARSMGINIDAVERAFGRR